MDAFIHSSSFGAADDDDAQLLQAYCRQTLHDADESMRVCAMALRA